MRAEIKFDLIIEALLLFVEEEEVCRVEATTDADEMACILKFSIVFC